MLYDLQIPQKKKPTFTYIFGTRLLLTLGVTVLGKVLNPAIFKPFTSIDDIIDEKNKMPKPNRTNIPITIKKGDDAITITGRLYKNNGLGHDPNIGALSIISACLRKLGWNKTIIIKDHGLSQCHIGKGNKFVKIANYIKIELDNLSLPQVSISESYWHYETKGEKLATIFIHIAVENFTESYAIFDNHAGCEKSYFLTSDDKHIALAKYYDRAKYKAGDKSQIIHIPDLVILDIKDQQTVTIEGKKYECREKGIEEIERYGSFEEKYLKYYYPEFEAIRTVVLYGGSADTIVEVQIGFLLNKNGKMVLGIKAPQIFIQAIKNLLNYWN